jgi:hypothetical protein
MRRELYERQMKMLNEIRNSKVAESISGQAFYPSLLKILGYKIASEIPEILFIKTLKRPLTLNEIEELKSILIGYRNTSNENQISLSVFAINSHLRQQPHATQSLLNGIGASWETHQRSKVFNWICKAGLLSTLIFGITQYKNETSLQIASYGSLIFIGGTMMTKNWIAETRRNSLELENLTKISDKVHF